MHPFVTAVLLWMAGFDALELDPEPQPPHGELAQAIQGVGRGEGDPVVCAYRNGKPEVLERSLKDCECVGFLRSRQGFAAEQVAAGKVGDGERVAVLAVGEHEFALVVGAPELVRVHWLREHGPLRPMATPPAPHQAMPIEHRVDGADGGALHRRVLTPTAPAALRGAPPPGPPRA